MAVIIGNARIAETGGVNGAKGDQTKREVMLQDWNTGGTWEYVFRCKDSKKAAKIAAAMKAACKNNNIGYSQADRRSLYNIVSANGWKIAKAGKCNCDCSSLVAVCVNAAGIKVSPDMYTGNELKLLKATGQFTTYTGITFTKSSAKLKAGDILLRNGHTAIVVQGNETTKKASATKATVKKSIDTAVKEVKAGKYGNEPERSKKLKAAGYTAAEIKDIQSKVNASAKASAKKSIDAVANEIVQGKWGNGLERNNKLVKAGYTTAERQQIQKKVNLIMGR